MTTVVSLRSGEPYDILVTRPGPYGNPFSHISATCTSAPFRTLSRFDAVRKHAEWLRLPEQATLLLKIRRELRDKVLCCTCDQTQIKREMCHAVTLAKVANQSHGWWV